MTIIIIKTAKKARNDLLMKHRVCVNITSRVQIIRTFPLLGKKLKFQETINFSSAVFTTTNANPSTKTTNIIIHIYIYRVIRPSVDNFESRLHSSYEIILMFLCSDISFYHG